MTERVRLFQPSKLTRAESLLVYSTSRRASVHWYWMTWLSGKFGTTRAGVTGVGVVRTGAVRGGWVCVGTGSASPVMVRVQALSTSVTARIDAIDQIFFIE